ncbi:MAG: C39 family peptidase [Patescibacteria group bacterium]
MKKAVFLVAVIAIALFITVNAVMAAWSERTVFVKFFSQKDPSWAGDVMVSPYKMADSGCLVTSTAQVLNYYYISTNPKSFNNWLKDQKSNGYDSKGRISSWDAVKAYTGGKVIASKYSSDCWNITRNEILSGRLCVIKTYLYGVEHWVVVRGYENGKFTINDPLDASFQLRQYGGTIYAVVTFAHKVDPGLDAIFNDARDRNGGTSKVGSPVNGYHYWGSLIVRDYDGGSYGWCIITYLYPNAGVRKAYPVCNGFWEKWRQLNGPYSFLGMPITDEYPSFKYKDANGKMRARQDFADGGYMVWYGDHARIYNWKGQVVSGVSAAGVDSTTALIAPVIISGIKSVYPNPFNPQTTISFQLSAAGEVDLVVYNAAGQRVRTLAAGPFPAGNHSLVWSGIDETGSTVASGVYFARLSADNIVSTRKMVLLK